MHLKELKNTIRSFNETCEEIKQHFNAEIGEYCMQVVNQTILKEAETTKIILSTFKPPGGRKKRDGGTTIVLLASISMSIASLVKAYQKENDKIVATDTEIINLTEKMFHKHETVLNGLIDENVKQTIRADAITILNDMQELINEVNIYTSSFTPYNKLHDELKKKNHSVIVPPTMTTKQYFSLHRPNFLLEDGVFILHYPALPLVEEKPYKRYVVMVYPDYQNNSFVLDNHNHMQVIVRNNSNNFYLNLVQKSVSNFFEMDSLVTLENSKFSCTLALLNGNQENICRKEKYVPNFTDIEINDDFLYIEREQLFNIKCGNHSEETVFAALISKACSKSPLASHFSHISATSTDTIYEKQSSNISNIKHITKQLNFTSDDFLFNEMKKNVTERFEKDDSLWSWNWNFEIPREIKQICAVFLIIVGFILVLIYLFYCAKCCSGLTNCLGKNLTK